MDMTFTDESHGSIPKVVREFRSARGARPFTGAGLTFASALLFAGLGLSIGAALENIFPRGQMRVLRVPDEEVMIGLVAAGVFWLATLAFLWKPALSKSRVSRGGDANARAVLISVVIAVIIAAAIVGLNFVRISGDEYFTVGFILLGLGFIFLLWTPTFSQLDRRFVATTPEGKIDLRCPKCGYAMIGLQTARCPECGSEYTIDELVQLQQ